MQYFGHPEWRPSCNIQSKLGRNCELGQKMMLTSRFMTSTVKRDAISGPPTAQDNITMISPEKERLQSLCAHCLTFPMTTSCHDIDPKEQWQ